MFNITYYDCMTSAFSSPDYHGSSARSKSPRSELAAICYSSPSSKCLYTICMYQFHNRRISFQDPLIMASLHTVQQVQLQKPLAQSTSRGKWNSMHARIARYIQEQQNKSKVKKRKSSLSNR